MYTYACYYFIIFHSLRYVILYFSDIVPKQNPSVVNGFSDSNGHTLDDFAVNQDNLLDNNTTSIGLAPVSSNPSLTSSSFATAARVEPEKIRKWREEQSSRIEKKGWLVRKSCCHDFN